MNSNVVYHLRSLTGYSFEKISNELEKRIAVEIDPLLLEYVNNQQAPSPEWITQPITQWIIELWQEERANCESKELWSVDRKYCGVLGKLTVTEFIKLTGAQQGL